MAKHRTGKSYKGCCIMCGFHTLRGVGAAEQRSGAELKRAFEGRKRRVKRNDVPRKEEW
jgi:hypothetical protein